VAEIPEGFELVDSGIPEGFEVVGNEPQGTTLLQDIETGFQNIPGAPQLSEFAAAANRSVFDVIDFIGPDTVNSVLSLSGSDKRVPTLSESIGSEGGFVEPGLQRDILQAAGETAPLALSLGASLRGLSAKLAPATGGESVGAGVLREAGKSTAAQDVGLGTLSAAGQEVGREVGGEEGALIGGVVTPLAVSIPLTAAKNAASSLLKKAAPAIDQLKATARGIYQSLDESGVSIPSKSFSSLVDDISKTLSKEGIDPDLTPKATAVLKRLNAERGLDKNLTEIDTLRKVAKNAADSIEPAERRLGAIAIDKIDNFLDDAALDIGGGKEAGKAFRSARDLWQRAKKTEILDQAISDAELQATGFENGIRTQFRAIAKKINSGKLKGFTKEEVASIRKVADGTTAGNVARFLGKFGILDGVTSRSLTTLGGAGLAGAVGGTGAAAAVPLIGQVSGALAQRMTLNNAKMAKSIIQSGKNGSKIASIYIRNTPAAERSAAELAELFIKNQVPVKAINTKTATPLISSAAIIANMANNNDKKETE
jgi:hypothetical protein